MELISNGTQENPFKILKADHGLYHTRGLQFELILSMHVANPATLAIELLVWCYNKFYVLNEQRWLAEMINNDVAFEKGIEADGRFKTILRAREVPKNHAAVQRCFPEDGDFIQEKTHARRNKFISIELDNLSNGKTQPENKEA